MAGAGTGGAGARISTTNRLAACATGRSGKTDRSIRMTLSLAFLAPDIVKAAVEGRLPRGYGLKRLIDLPMAWPDQWRGLGLEAPARISTTNRLAACTTGRSTRCRDANGRAKRLRANSNSGNGNLRPETLGSPCRQRSRECSKPTRETGSRRTGYGNLGLFPPLGNHVGSR
jgi:hypothetical protein